MAMVAEKKERNVYPHACIKPRSVGLAARLGSLQSMCETLPNLPNHMLRNRIILRGLRVTD
ncbi:unnamed protein product [Sphenostylis stenocarpa]|uniref:Uncharacterized protein n=1 Tax=Sphenostylis stenocarpa TaxID=92480 RepID=A0AA86RN46_9FABA|nr:unnamed protein product [Sphenostylis stenocarpa]